MKFDSFITKLIIRELLKANPKATCKEVAIFLKEI